MKRILFSSNMVQAIKDGKKTVTRQVVKGVTDSMYHGRCALGPGMFDKRSRNRVIEPMYRSGDILYVPETWWFMCCDDYSSKKAHGICKEGKTPQLYKGAYICVGYKLDWDVSTSINWKAPCTMPEELARIFIKVTSVRIERLQDITEKQINQEGIYDPKPSHEGYTCEREIFSDLWNSTIKKSDIDIYGWNANPLVWVIEFERCEKPTERGNNERRTSD